MTLWHRFICKIPRPLVTCDMVRIGQHFFVEIRFFGNLVHRYPEQQFRTGMNL